MEKDERDKILQAGDQLITLSTMERPRPSDFRVSDPLAILIHGFTSHGKYLVELGSDLKEWGIHTFLFNYNSYRGIHVAANVLKDLVRTYNINTGGEISRKKLFLIAHSMGGLVARKFALDPEVRGIVRGIIMLGTPNKGAFEGNRLLQYFVTYGEYLSKKIMPDARVPTCVSGQQLIKADNPGGVPFIDQLNEDWKKYNDHPPVLTISGGKRSLELFSNPIKNGWANRQIQKAMGNRPNDGLVAEDSVNISTDSVNDRYRHLNSYHGYSDLNHTNLVANQLIAGTILNWIKERQKPATASNP
jgi:Serine aminopeptidase, S33